MGIFGTSQQGQPRYSGELHNLQVTESVYGTTAPIVIGTCRVHGKLLFYGGFNAVPAPNSGKGVFGGKTTEYEYYADTQILLGQCGQSQTYQGLLNVWDQNGKLQNQGGSFPYTIPGSGPNVIPSTSPAVGADLGVYKTQSYSVTANDYGAGGSKTLTGNQQVRFTRVASSPASGEYTFNASTGEYGFSTADAGVAVAINYSTVFSLYYYQQTQAAEIPGSPYQVSTDNQAYFSSGTSVIFVDTGATLTRVGGTPSATGEYNQTNGVYTFYSGDAGRYVYINYVYTSSDPNLTNSSTLNLTFFNGAQSQAPWSYMTSKYPSAAFGYSGLCYLGANPLALGESASMPDYNYEIVGLVPFGGGIMDAHPCDALRLLLTDPLLGVGFPAANVDSWTNAYAYWAANSYFISISIDTQSPATQALAAAIEAGNVAPVWSGGLLKLIPYGDTTAVGNGYTFTPPTTPAATLTIDDLLPASEHDVGQTTSDDPIQCSVRAPQDCMNYVQAQWTNRENDYNNELTPEQNDAFIKLYGFRPESPQTWDFITTQAAANFALQLRLKRNCYIRNTYKFWLPFWFSALEPMDLVVLPTGEPVRITQIQDDVDGRLSIEAEQWTYGTGDVTIYPKQPPTSYQPTTSQAIPGNTVPIFIQSTLSKSVGAANSIQIAATGTNPNWGGAKAYVSFDGTTYSLLGTVPSPSVMGLLSAALPSSLDPDTTDTLSVDITQSIQGNPSAELVSVSQQIADNFGTLCAIIDQAGTNEFVSYETATLTAQGRYNLTYIRRGVFSSMIGAHSIGASFAFLGQSYKFLDYQFPVNLAPGSTIYIKLASFNLAGNQLQNLSDCQAWPFTVSLQGSFVQETYVPTTFSSTTPTGSASCTNPTDAYDKDFNTGAVFDSGAGVTGAVIISYGGFGTGILAEPLTLYIAYNSAVYNGIGSTGGVVFSNWTFDGVTFTGGGLSKFGSVSPSGVIAAAVPQGTNLADILVKIIAENVGAYPSSAKATISEIWLQ